MNKNISILGLLGEHIEESISPHIQQYFIDYYKLKYIYLPFQIATDELEDAVKAIKVMGIKGMNVTNPFKERVIRFMDKIDLSVTKIGALNTIVCEKGKLYGYNTDWFGFQKPLKDELDFCFNEKKVIVLGAGGAARAVIFSLVNGGCSKISIFNRSYSNAHKIKKDFTESYPHCQIEIFSPVRKYLQEEIDTSHLIINTTPLGSWYYPDISPLPDYIKFPSEIIFYDLIYYPDKTPMLKKAEKNGNLFLNGKAMLVYQAARSFCLWTGIEVEQSVVDKILRKI